MARRRGEKKREDEREKFGSPVRCSSPAPPLDLLCAGVRSPARGDEKREKKKMEKEREIPGSPVRSSSSVPPRDLSLAGDSFSPRGKTFLLPTRLPAWGEGTRR
ncbi:hypothetical protein B296_00029525, partial [Ensete ventricosum]